jgi:uncharacterized protein (DUF1800 family)
VHVLNRLGYGPRAGDVEAIRAMGVKRYLDAQLDPESIPFPPALQAKLDALPTYRLTPAQAFVQYGPPSYPPDTATPEEKRTARELTPETHLARLWLATESPRQLQEAMTEFWFNHFNVFENKEWVRYWVADYERTIRQHALGNFRELLGAVAHHPAMLYYLDNWRSSGQGAPGAKGRFNGLNENYARELMELHTLGVNANYTQDDVIALARILTGWTIDVNSMKQGGPAFAFNPRRHDNGVKRFLGRTIQPAGEREGEQALDILAQQPDTAKLIATQLVQCFVSDKPDPVLVDRMAQRFLATHGDIKAVLRTLLDSPQFWSRANYQAKFKTPYQFVVSTLRATGTPVVNAKPVDNALTQLGMPLYGWLTPDGYKTTQDAWLNPDAMLRRINFALTLAKGNAPMARAEGAAPPANAPMQAGPLLDTLGPAIGLETMARLQAQPDALRAGLVLGSPDFMKR